MALEVQGGGAMLRRRPARSSGVAAAGQPVRFETVPLAKFATQMLPPSNATPPGPEPTGNVPWAVPSLARSLLNVLPPLFATQMLLPSDGGALEQAPEW